MPDIINHEYLSAIITTSTSSEFLLDPGQDTTTSILQTSSLFSDNHKTLLSNFFRLSAEASQFCTQLLTNLTRIQSDYTFIRHVITAIDTHPSAALDLHSCITLTNPFSDLRTREFDRFQTQHSAILHHLKSNRNRIARKIKFIKYLNKTSGICITAACGAAAGAAVFLAIHTLTALVMTPALLSIPIKPLKKKFQKRVEVIGKLGFLKKTAEQIEAAAKGVYILGREFETMRNEVGRIEEEIEHNKMLMRICVERMGMGFPWMVVEELKRYELGLRKMVEEMEEHVCLCLFTINRVRALLLQEINY